MSEESSRTGKFMTPAEAVALIRDGDTVVTGGFVGTGSPDLLFKALAENINKYESAFGNIKEVGAETLPPFTMGPKAQA